MYEWNLDNTQYRSHQQMQMNEPQEPAHGYPNCDTLLHISVPHHGLEEQLNYIN